MRGTDVADFYAAWEAEGFEVWIDGGWGVDALLERETRPHGDLDITVLQEHCDGIVSFLKKRGFVDVPRNDTRAWNFVMGDPAGREVDFHVIQLDGQGKGIYGPPENGQYYSAESLTGVGRIGGQSVRCISVSGQLTSHSGYCLREVDYLDVRHLCEHFELPLPDGFEDDG